MRTNEQLAVSYQEGDEYALHEICVQNKGLVVNISRGFRGDEDDLIQAGMMGMIEAVSRFDISRGAKFTTYAANWIFARCVTCAKEMNGIVNVNGREGRKVLSLVGRVRKGLHDALGREPSLSEISEEMGIDEETVAAVISVSGSSLNASVGSESHTPLSELIPDASQTPEQMSESLSTIRAVRAFADQLDKDFEKFVFLNVIAGPMTNQKAGDIRGVSRQRVNQIVKRIEPKFKLYAETMGLEA